METSYSFTTVRVDPDGTPAISVHLIPDRQMSVYCSDGGHRAQIAFIHAGANVTITPTNPESPTAEDLVTARRLAELFGRYVAEVERLHALSVASMPSESAESAA
ncbi:MULTISPECIES: hypothetical protein [Actinomadura]|uniref:hypothetical protein n=1 Tax=Actinomadura TaxID=1988 RepID=UPI002164C151|nr:hypothetical protein [Actinomadura glauciflava]MCR3738598.1 hypothetical protein [Actinomadura glauciflava]